MKKNNPPKKPQGCHEVQIHYKRPLFDIREKVDSSKDAEEVLRKFSDPMRLDHKEFFWAILMTNDNQVIGIGEVSIGSTRGTVTNHKEIFQLALLLNASAIIIAHNHPSGKLKPSQTDLNVTSDLKEVGRMLEIDLVDHIILTSEGYLSLADEGLM